MEADFEAAQAFALAKHEFAIFTSSIGLYRGRVFVFREEADGTRQKWIGTLRRVLESYDHDKPQRASVLDIARRTCRWHYAADSTQIAVALLIVANFVVNIAQAQLPGKASVLHLRVGRDRTR